MNYKLLLLVSLVVTRFAAAGNPIIKDRFTADPTARAFGNRVYLYTTHDLPNATYWDTIDWELFSTPDMVTWKAHGAFFRLKDFGWAQKFAWAPDVVSRGGKYFAFLPVDRTKIGVAVAESPEGPFKDAIGGPLLDHQTMPKAGPEPIDPCVLLDDDGQSYMYFGCRTPKVVKLDPSLVKLSGEIQDISVLDAAGKPVPIAAPGSDPVLPQGYAEAPFVFKHDGKYYFTYSDGWVKGATLVYAIGDKPTGPFTYAGKIMEPAASVTQHGSIVNFHGKWYLFYHTQDIPNGNTFRRAVCVEEMTFDGNGRINTVKPTKQGPAGN